MQSVRYLHKAEKEKSMLDWQLMTGWTGDYYEKFPEQCNLSFLSFKHYYPELDTIVARDSKKPIEFFDKYGCKYLELNEGKDFGKYYDNIRFRALLQATKPTIWVDPDVVAYCRIPLDMFETEYDYIGFMSEKNEFYTIESNVDSLYSHLPFLEKPNKSYTRTGHNPGVVILKDPKKLQDVFKTILKSMKYLAENKEYDWCEHVVLTQTLSEILIEEKGLSLSTLDMLLGFTRSVDVNSVWHHLTFSLDPYYSPWPRFSKAWAKGYNYLLEKLIQNESISQNDLRKGLRKAKTSLI